MHDRQKEKNLPDLENESIYSIGVEINSTTQQELNNDCAIQFSVP